MAQQAVTRLDYCQFLLSSQINYTITHFAEHAQRWSHDTVNRYLRTEKITPCLLWENVREEVILSEDGYLLFDDTVLDKNHSRHIELARKQYSGNEKRVIRGIGVVSCIYVNAEVERFWAVDYRVFDPEGDGKTKLDHVREMLAGVVHAKGLSFRRVVMDTWYASMPLMKQVERYGKYYYATVKSDRKVSEGPALPYERVDALEWSAEELTQGKLVHLNKFPKGHQVKLFRLAFSPERTDYLVTNELAAANEVAQSSAEAAQEAFGQRWKVEQFHREVKQVTGIERCQCRSGRIQRNHIGCALLVWTRLRAVAEKSRQTVYALKHGLLSKYLIQQLKRPTIRMTLA